MADGKQRIPASARQGVDCRTFIEDVAMGRHAPVSSVDRGFYLCLT
ncbi:hypothetical protein FHS61_002995 [Altererythrobacter atlanticus]|nr:hypothetical protein [Croceibacterium atlanticum]MBB5733948.1 hypothetical protein [Croceibacterium atlanticum]